ncbi:MAG: phage portal protein [Candidatus Limiplasma sp.]|nr:phage portal protein [Candidatus Limiplasma sp.]MEA5145549.1 phage portal protein [Candidatus Limiplasma sp.]
MNDNGNMIEQWLDKQGYRCVDSDYRMHIQRFREWFEGYCPEFHDYRVTAQRAQRKLKRYSLGMAKTVCEDYATLLLNEKVQISANGFKVLPDLLRDNRFFERGNRLIEWVFALGTGALVEFIDESGAPTIDYIRGDLIYPLNWDGDNITECAFGSRRVLGARKDAGEGYYVQVHERRDGKYFIRNVWLDKDGKELPPPEGVEPESGPFAVPLFQIIRPNTVNSIDPDSPMGMSIFGASIDQLKAVDLVYDSYVNEFQLGKKRLMVPQSFQMQALQEDGTLKPMFDPNDLIYNVYQVGDNATDKLQAVDMELRAEAHEQGLQRMIDLLSKRCGLGVGRYRVADGGAKTATEVISEDSDLYQSVKRHEKPLERVIIGMVRALSALSGGAPDIDVGVEFDDSIFEDTGTTIARNIQLVTAGLKSKRAAIMEIAGCDEKEAEKRLQEIASEQMIEAPNVDVMFAKGEEA